MSSPAPTAKPKLDDQYWFNFSETLVGKALDSRDLAAQKLQSLALWLWGIYTSLAAVGFTLAGKSLSGGETIQIALPSAALIVVYWLTVWVQMPKLVAFDPRAPDEIREKAYAANLRAKHFRLTLAIVMSVVAALLVARALWIASTAKAEVAPVIPRFTAALSAGEVAVTGYVGKADRVRVSATAQGKETGGTYVPLENGTLQVSLPVDAKADPVRVSLEWTDASGSRVQLSREVKRK